jgi:hypothetical protein
MGIDGTRSDGGILQFRTSDIANIGLTQAHYLQAGSSPEPCWALLGSSTRMAISLGFHQRTFREGTFNDIELEEGKRAWWLCYVMEKYQPSIFYLTTPNT